MAPGSEVYMAMKEINSGLEHLRQEHARAERTVAALLDQILVQEHHINNMNDMMDEHQCKLDDLMRLVLDGETTSRSSAPVKRMAVSSLNEQADVSDEQPAAPNADPDSDSDVHYLALKEHEDTDFDATSLSLKLFNAEDKEDPNWSTALAAAVRKSSRHRKRPKPKFDPSDASGEPEEQQDSTPPSPQSSEAAQKIDEEKATRASNSFKFNMSWARIQRRYYSKTALDPYDPPLSSNSRAVQAHLKLPGNRSRMYDHAVTMAVRPPTEEEARRVDKTTGKVTWECCGHGFIAANQFRRHVMAIHTNERPFKCDQCSYATVQKTALIRHRQSIHQLDLKDK